MGSWVLKRFGLNINIGHDYKLDSIFTEYYSDIYLIKKNFLEFWMPSF